MGRLLDWSSSRSGSGLEEATTVPRVTAADKHCPHCGHLQTYFWQVEKNLATPTSLFGSMEFVKKRCFCGMSQD